LAVYLIIASVFVAVFLFFFAILYVISKRRDPVQLRLKSLTGEDEGNKEDGRSSLEGVVDILGLGAEQVKAVKLKLAQAGYRGPQSVFNYYGMRLFSAIFCAAASLPAALYFHLEHSLIFLLAISAAIVGAYIPWIWVSRKVVRRREQIRRSVPNILDLIVVCVEAGLSLNAAIQKIIEETRGTHSALSEELHLVNQEILIGKTRVEAFRNLARRTGVDELRSLAVMLIQSDKLGTSIANSLRVLADSLRVKRRQHAEEAARKMQVKLVFPLVLLIFPELLVILMGPAVIGLVKALSQIGR
jgi:tight adherence protein C